MILHLQNGDVDLKEIGKTAEPICMMSMNFLLWLMRRREAHAAICKHVLIERAAKQWHIVEECEEVSWRMTRQITCRTSWVIAYGCVQSLSYETFAWVLRPTCILLSRPPDVFPRPLTTNNLRLQACALLLDNGERCTTGERHGNANDPSLLRRYSKPQPKDPGADARSTFPRKLQIHRKFAEAR